MDLPPKRLLTEDARAASVASASSAASTSIPDDLAAQLRNVGSRVRKNVLEGYTTAPSRGVFAKAHTTGRLFVSAKDALREVYTWDPASMPRSRPSPSSKKRRLSLSLSDRDPESGDDDTTDADNRNEMQTDQLRLSCSNESVPSGGPIDAADIDRPMKPLRKPRQTVTATRSLPAGSFRFGGTSEKRDGWPQESAEEEDWSVGGGEQEGFAPMML